MSCNGCRVLRKGCNDTCILRQSLQGIDSPQAQGNATLFVAKFFGRAGLISFLSAVPQSQRPPLFQSLLFEACGRTVNPVNGAVGLLWTGNWHVCQSAVETVLRGGSVCAMPELFTGPSENDVELSEVFCNDGRRVDLFRSQQDLKIGNKRKAEMRPEDLDLCLTSRRRSVTPASDESDTTTLESLARVRTPPQQHQQKETKLLRLFL